MYTQQTGSTHSLKYAWFFCVLGFLIYTSGHISQNNEAFGAEQSLTIEINGEAIDRSVTPFVYKGTTFVPMRPIFDALSITLLWDQKKGQITGLGSTGTFQLKLNHPQAIVNGTTLTLSHPPFFRNGSTLVPLRFVAEAVEAVVTFDRPNQKIIITNQQSTMTSHIHSSVEEATLRKRYSEMLFASNEGDHSGMMSKIHPFSPVRSWISNSFFDSKKRRTVVSELLSFQIEKIDVLTATVRIKEQHKRSSGAFFVDHTSTALVTWRKHPAEGWLVYDILPQQFVWIDSLWPEAPNVSAETTLSIRTILQTYANALTKKRIDDAQALWHTDAPNRATIIDSLQTMNDAYDLIHEIEDVRIVGQDQDELYVYSVQTTRKTNGPPAITDVRSQTVHTFRRQGPGNGPWKLYSSFHGPQTELNNNDTQSPSSKPFKQKAPSQ